MKLQTRGFVARVQIGCESDVTHHDNKVNDFLATVDLNHVLSMDENPLRCDGGDLIDLVTTVKYRA